MALQRPVNPRQRTALVDCCAPGERLDPKPLPVAVRGLKRRHRMSAGHAYGIGREGGTVITYSGTTTTTRWQPWTYRDQNWTSAKNLVGYKIDARDGEIGAIDDATYDVGSSYIVVDTGPWIFGRKVMLPAGVVGNVDHANKRVMIDRT